MPLAFPLALALAQRCAPAIAPEAILSIVTVESAFDPLAINVNHVGRVRARTAPEAVAIASRWISAGYSVDLGLAQINSRNLAWAGLSITAAFEPCASLAAAEKILAYNYARASRDVRGREAISRTFSLYNSGSVTIGFRNRYVARVWQAGERIMPQIVGLPAAIGTAAIAAPEPATNAVATSFVVGPTDRSVLIFK